MRSANPGKFSDSTWWEVDSRSDQAQIDPMRMLTNDYHDFHLLNLGLDEDGRGPYLVIQEGVPPGAMKLEQDRFILLRGGTWMLNFTFMTLPEAEQHRHLFATVADVYEQVKQLPHTPRVNAELPADMNRDQILRAVDRSQNHLAQLITQSRKSRELIRLS